MSKHGVTVQRVAVDRKGWMIRWKCNACERIMRSYIPRDTPEACRIDPFWIMESNFAASDCCRISVAKNHEFIRDQVLILIGHISNTLWNSNENQAQEMWF